MKFRNILLTTFAASAFVIGTTSCSDSFLDEKMYSSYGPEVSDVNAKLVGLHRQYAAIWGMSSQRLPSVTRYPAAASASGKRLSHSRLSCAAGVQPCWVTVSTISDRVILPFAAPQDFASDALV